MMCWNVLASSGCERALNCVTAISGGLHCVLSEATRSPGERWQGKINLEKMPAVLVLGRNAAMCVFWQLDQREQELPQLQLPGNTVLLCSWMPSGAALLARSPGPSMRRATMAIAPW
jgi:hypothetical protein